MTAPENPPVIYLDPPDHERCWSVHDEGPCPECGEPWTKYVRADAIESLERQLAEERDRREKAEGDMRIAQASADAAIADYNDARTRADSLAAELARVREGAVLGAVARDVIEIAASIADARDPEKPAAYLHRRECIGQAIRDLMGNFPEIPDCCAGRASLAAELARMRDALAQIGRMHLFPDDAVNRTTLQAAIHIVSEALASKPARTEEETP